MFKHHQPPSIAPSTTSIIILRCSKSSTENESNILANNQLWRSISLVDKARGFITHVFCFICTRKIAVEGCCHGELDATYNHIAELEQRNGYKVDLLLICGDFQAIRNHLDLQCMAVPQKYRQLGGFYRCGSIFNTTECKSLLSISGREEQTGISRVLCYSLRAAQSSRFTSSSIVTLLESV